MRYINEIKADERVTDHFMCKDKQSLKSRNGKTYFSLKLQDKTGTIDAKVWDLTKDIQSFEKNDVIKIDGTSLSYQNDIQIKVVKIRKSEDGEYDPTDLIPATKENIDEMYNKFISYIDTISNDKVKEMLLNIFVHDSVISQAIKTHSAAKSMHHNYLGGLLEHTLGIVEICNFLANQYSSVNRDVLIASAMLHDVGKVYELSSFPENDYTDIGQLLGHLIIGIELVTYESKKIESFPKEYKNLIKHCLVAHHGELEYGSPKKPATLEAYLLHMADNIDAKSKMYLTAIENDSTNAKWVGYDRVLGTNIRRSIENE
ncbi:MAG: 3'-5' exoribonuclease YhaM family protein [Lachnospirales bacterium]